MLLAGKTAVVTGSNRGIGKATVELLSRHGAAVFACARKPSDEMAEFTGALSSETGTAVIPVYFDLNDPAAVKEGLRSIMAGKAPIDVLVNNAGSIQTAPFAMTSETAMRGSFEVNFFAPMLLTQQIARAMVRRKRGSIVNIASSAAIEGNEGRSAYAGAKAALIAASKVMARELGPAGIRVNAVAPGLTQTDMMTSSTTLDALEDTVRRTAMRRVGQPAEIAGAILFLASDLSSFLTGQVLRVDGGM